MKNVKEDDVKSQCCAAWKVADCWTEKAVKNCTADDLKSFGDSIKGNVIHTLNLQLCKRYQKDSVKCNSGSSVKIELYSIAIITLLSFYLQLNLRSNNK
jgi:hypothetical protein